MNDDRLLTTDPNQVIQSGDERTTVGGLKNDQNNVMMQSGNGLINSEEIRTVTDYALNENHPLKEQLAHCLTAWKSWIAEMELIKKFNAQRTQEFIKIHEKSKRKVQQLNHTISQLQKQNDILKKEYQSPSKSPPQERRDVEPLRGNKSPIERKAIPLSPTGQRAYNQSLENVLGQLQALRPQFMETNTALNKERMSSKALDKQLKKNQEELNALQGIQETHVAEAIERQRKEDDMKHRTEMDGMTLLAAEKHQKHAFDESIYHSVIIDLRQQVTSLTAELELKDRCLNEEKSYVQQQEEINEALQSTVSMIHKDQAKARQEAQSYIDTIRVELKRKETLCQSERQKAFHEKLHHDKCKEELGTAKVKLNQLMKDRNEYQEKEDRYLAEILSAKEAIEAKERETLKYEQQAMILNNEGHLLKTQYQEKEDRYLAEILSAKKAFEAKERETLEYKQQAMILNNEGHFFKTQMKSVAREIMFKLKEELQQLHREQLHAYGPATGYGYDARTRDDMFGIRRQDFYGQTGENEAGNPVWGFQAPYQIQELLQMKSLAMEIMFKLKEELQHPKQLHARNCCFHVDLLHSYHRSGAGYI